MITRNSGRNVARDLGRVVAIGCASIAFAASTTACKKAAALAFEPKTAQITIDDEKGVSAPHVVALDKDGNALDKEKTPEVAFTTDPLGIVTIDTTSANGPRLVPQKNGDTKLHAEAPGLPAAEVPVHVAVVDDVKLACIDAPTQSLLNAGACVVHVGELLHLDVRAMGLGEKLTTGVELASSDPAKADVDKSGTVTAKAPGLVTITAKAGKKAADLKVEVRPAVDEVRLLCPWPPIVVVTRKSADEGMVARDRSCEVGEGDEMTLLAQVVAQDHVVEGEKLDWKSSDPSVRVVGATVTGDKAGGGGMVELHVADLVAEMPVSVLTAKQKPKCSEADANYTKNFDTVLSWKNAAGEGNDTIGARCEQGSAKKCLADGAAEIGRALEKAPLDPTSSATYAKTAFAARAARCCCKPAAASTTAEH